jgi:hypothetical protein
MAAAGGWRYLAQRMTGDGAFGDFIDLNLPLANVEIDEVLSGHHGFHATITPEIMRLKGPNGRPLLDEWGCAIWAEGPDGEIRGGGILQHSTFMGPSWSLECISPSGALIDLPYTEARFWVNVDPLDIYREIWRYAQAQQGGNLGVTMDATRSPMLLGGDLVQRVEFDTEEDVTEAQVYPLPVAPNRYATNSDWKDAAVKAMKATGWNADVVRDALTKWLNKDDLIAQNKWPKGGLTDKETTIKKKAIEKVGLPPDPPNGTVAAPKPTAAGYTEPTAEAGDLPIYEYDAYKLAWYKDHDLASTVDELASMTPFDWNMTHRWNGDEIAHHIRIGYPRLGRRREDLRFVIGENISVLPSIERDGTEYANEVLVLGAGEGSAQVVGRAFRNDGRIRRVAVVSAPWIQHDFTANAHARLELQKRVQIDDITEIILRDHPHAPMGSVDLGDEILVEGETGWSDLEVWCRVIGRKISPESADSMVLTIIRSDRIA